MTKDIAFPKPPDYVPNEETRFEVLKYAKMDCPQAFIAAQVGLDLPTLRKHYKPELDNGLAAATFQVAAGLYANALNGNVDAQKFWLARKGKWSEEMTQLTNSINQIQNKITVEFVSATVGTLKAEQPEPIDHENSDTSEV